MGVHVFLCYIFMCGSYLHPTSYFFFFAQHNNPPEWHPFLLMTTRLAFFCNILYFFGHNGECGT